MDLLLYQQPFLRQAYIQASQDSSSEEEPAKNGPSKDGPAKNRPATDNKQSAEVKASSDCNHNDDQSPVDEKANILSSPGEKEDGTSVDCNPMIQYYLEEPALQEKSAFTILCKIFKVCIIQSFFKLWLACDFEI